LGSSSTLTLISTLTSSGLLICLYIIFIKKPNL
jgi:hypothetical protein